MNLMALQTRTVEYTHNDVLLEAFMAWDDSATGPRPGVLVSHAFRGRESFECDRAVALAGMGYVGFALDLYGKGVQATTSEEAFGLMGAFTEDRVMLQSRLAACLATAQAQPEIDAQQLAAIGYCFGGLCALDMARSGLPLAGVVSFHGLLLPPGNTEDNAITTRILVEHGWDDPMVPPEQVLDFTREMSVAGADWQLHAHGNTVHAFTNPDANDAEFGTVYNADAERRSWQSLENFLGELFG
jgi:dienelactone hydrolase